MPKTITYGELPETAGLTAIYCIEHLNGYSATRGDYFRAPRTDVVTCGECDQPMMLARSVTTLEEV